MKKRGSAYLVLGIVLTVILIVIFFLYFILFSPRNESLYKNNSDARLINPTEGKSLEQAASEFNESYIFYMLYNIEAYNLHNPPLSPDTPKIEIIADDAIYGAEIRDGLILVWEGEAHNKDIVIRTTKKEVIAMINNPSYISQSFMEEKSNIELTASQTLLFSKGYLNIYKKLTGESITGSVIRIYTD